MSEDTLKKAVENISKYERNVDEAMVNKIIKHLGIALRSRDASMVSCSQASELATVRDKFLKKKLGLTQSDAELDAALKELCEQMKGEKNKSRITVYYLLAKKFGKESVFA